MTKKEKEMFDGIVERAGEKKANPIVIAAALALLFPARAEGVKKDGDIYEELNKGEINE